jgi:hypothetical protein
MDEPMHHVQGAMHRLQRLLMHSEPEAFRALDKGCLIGHPMPVHCGFECRETTDGFPNTDHDREGA